MSVDDTPCGLKSSDPMPLKRTPTATTTGRQTSRKSAAAASANRSRTRPQQTDASDRTSPSTAASSVSESASLEALNARFLESLIGYNARRAALSIIGGFMERMAMYDLKPVEFSVLSLVLHNPGITSRQLCAALNILPPNLVGLVQSLVKRGLIVRMPHPHDGRAIGLHPTPEGAALMTKAEKTVTESELEKTQRLTASERDTLLRLLQKIYL